MAKPKTTHVEQSAELMLGASQWEHLAMVKHITRSVGRTFYVPIKAKRGGGGANPASPTVGLLLPGEGTPSAFRDVFRHSRVLPLGDSQH